MPRLTNHIYLSNFRRLRVIWLDESSRLLLLLTPSQQWALHLYYVPFLRISKAALLEHRVTVSAYDPTLPQRAGRAYARLRQLEERLPMYRTAMAAGSKAKKGTPHDIRVFGEVNPTIDPDTIARILANYRPRE